MTMTSSFMSTACALAVSVSVYCLRYLSGIHGLTSLVACGRSWFVSGRWRSAEREGECLDARAERTRSRTADRRWVPAAGSAGTAAVRSPCRCLARRRQLRGRRPAAVHRSAREIARTSLGPPDPSPDEDRGRESGTRCARWACSARWLGSSPSSRRTAPNGSGATAPGAAYIRGLSADRAAGRREVLGALIADIGFRRPQVAPIGGRFDAACHQPRPAHG